MPITLEDIQAFIYRGEVANYSALPPAASVPNAFYWVQNSQGTRFIGVLWGGSYYPAGTYHSNGSSWEYMDTPSQATQAEVDAGTVTDKWVNPSTLKNSIFAVNASNIGSVINGASSATPNDADLVMSVESSVAKKNTWTQIKEFLKTYFDTLYKSISDENIVILSSISISTTSSTNTNLTELNTPVLANTVYAIEGVIRVGCNKTGGVAVQVTIPSGSVFISMNGFTTSSAAVLYTQISSSSTLSGSYCRLNSTIGQVHVKGTIEVGAIGGNLVWGFASAIDTQTSTVYRLGTQIKISKV